jgi:uncharacterized protein with HEPN domain
MPSEAEPTRAARLAWCAIRDNIQLAQDFIATMTAEEFAQDRRTFYAVTRCLEIISEAAPRLGPSQKEASPQLEWRQIEDSGNVFRHAYQHVAESRVWMTVQERLPDLLLAATAALGETQRRTHQPK